MLSPTQIERARRAFETESARQRPSLQPSPTRGEGAASSPLSPSGRGVGGEVGGEGPSRGGFAPHPSPLPGGEREHWMFNTSALSDRQSSPTPECPP
jgi:hypothetical protein